MVQVWVDFDWTGPYEADFFSSFLAAAVDAVADGGVIKILPGTVRERPFIHTDKQIRLVAPFGIVLERLCPLIACRFTFSSLYAALDARRHFPCRQNPSTAFIYFCRQLNYE
jgi:hypothetical protein